MTNSINFQEAIDNYNKSTQWNRHPKENEFYPSELTGCLRQAVRHRMGLTKFETETLRHFALGKMIHEFIQLKVAFGFIKRPVECEKRMHFQYGKYIFNGHVDMLDEETVYDFKTTANAEISAKYNMQTSYRYQVSLYVHGCNAKRGEIVYVDKRNLTVIQKEVKLISMETIEKFCDSVVDACLKYESTKELPDKDDCFACKSEKQTLLSEKSIEKLNNIKNGIVNDD